MRTGTKKGAETAANKKAGVEREGKVRFPIGAKLIMIVTLLLLLSLGILTGLVSFFVSRDVEKTAWETNRNINEMSASAVEAQIDAVQGKAAVLLNDISVFAMLDTPVGGENAPGDAPETDRNALVLNFFNENTDIACIYVAFPLSPDDEDGPALFQNLRFFDENGIDPPMIDAFIAVNRRDFPQIPRQSALFNAAPYLNGLPILALVFQGQSAAEQGAVAVFFSSETITTAFGTGANSTILINAQGAALVSADQDALTRKEANNFAQKPFIADVLKSSDLIMQERYFERDAQGGSRAFFGVSKRLNAGGSLVITTIPADVVFEGIKATTWRNILFLFGVWFLAVLFLWFFSKTISEPLKTLTKAAKTIEDGDYHLDFSSGGHDETGVLTGSVLSMSHVLENFENFTNKEIARLARQGKLELTGSSKYITMFFSDIRSFTAISEKLNPNEVVEFLNDYMERMIACVLLTGGVVDKFIGDAILAYWGAINTEGSKEQDALAGVKTALMMRAQLLCFNQNRGGDKKPVIKIGCGLNSGVAVAGQIGSAERVVFTVIGDTVSLADRTETLNKPLGTEILITEYTNELVKTHFITEKMGEITEDGKKLAVYAVINIRSSSPEYEAILADIMKLPDINMDIAHTCIGPEGPQTLDALRRLLNIPTPDLTNLDLDEDEKKYSIKDDSSTIKQGTQELNEA